MEIDSTVPIYDEDGNKITDPDLDAGYLRDCWVLNGDGSQTLEKYTYHVYGTQLHIDVLRQQLAATDYITAKTVDALAACEDEASVLAALGEFKAKYADTIQQRAAWREKINELENGK